MLETRDRAEVNQVVKEMEKKSRKAAIESKKKKKNLKLVKK